MEMKKQENQLAAFVAKMMTVDLEVSGNILFENTPVRDAVVEFVVRGTNGETLLALGKTLTGVNGHFYFKDRVPASCRGNYVGVRICAYSTPSSFGKPFPIFFGVETFAFSPQQNTYLLGDIRLPLTWSFCERPLFFLGKVVQKGRDESLFTGKKVQWQMPSGYILAETLVGIDGSYHLYTYGDGRLPDSVTTLLCIKDNDKTLQRVEVPLSPSQYVYTQNIFMNEEVKAG